MLDPFRVMVVAPNQMDFYYKEILIGAHIFANQREDLQIVRSREYSIMPWDLALTFKPDGILGTLSPKDHLSRNKLGKTKVVITSSDVQNHPFPCVVNDDLLAGQKAGLHLLERHLTHFAFIGPSAIYRARLSLRGYAKALREAGINDVLTFDSHVSIRDRDAFIEWLSTLPRPCGILCADDWIGCRAVKFAVEAGFDVPNEFAFIGITDREFSCVQCLVPFTSVRLNLRDLGYRAAVKMHNILTGNSPEPLIELVPPGEVTFRESTNVMALSDPTIRRAMMIIEQRFQESLTVESLLIQLGHVSRRHLEMKFREVLGTTPREEILNCRMRHAKKLLQSTKLSIEEIAISSGYGDLGHFSRQFKVAIGLPPSKYRNISTSKNSA